MATAPQTTRYDCNRIREGRRLLFVPGGSANWLNLGLDQPVSHQRLHISISAYCRRKLPRQRKIIPSANFSVVTLCTLSLTVSANVSLLRIKVFAGSNSGAPCHFREPKPGI